MGPLPQLLLPYPRQVTGSVHQISCLQPVPTQPSPTLFLLLPGWPLGLSELREHLHSLGMLRTLALSAAVSSSQTMPGTTGAWHTWADSLNRAAGPVPGGWRSPVPALGVRTPSCHHSSAGGSQGHSQVTSALLPSSPNILAPRSNPNPGVHLSSLVLRELASDRFSLGPEPKVCQSCPMAAFGGRLGFGGTLCTLPPFPIPPLHGHIIPSLWP